MARWVRLSVVLLLWSSLCFAQESNENEEFLFNSALDFIGFQDYESAHDLLLQLDSLKPNDPKYTFNIGVCLFSSIDKVKSLYYFLKARQLGYHNNPINYFLGLAYRYNYDLDNASYYLNQYLANLSNAAKDYEEKKHEALELIDQVESSKEILGRKLSVGVRNLGNAINSDAADYVPVLLSKDSVIIFTSRRKGSTGGRLWHDGSHYEDIYIARKNKKGEWERATHFPGFNGKHHDANVAINKAEDELYVFKVNGHGNIYVSKKNNHGDWRHPRPLKGINSSHWEGSICLSPKEDTIFFSSDRPGGFGGSDIYFAVKDKRGKWENVQNMGPIINTTSDEDAPYMHKDGKTFFFSSKGHNSIGGYDVFSTRRVKDSWSETKNVGFPINTVDDDIYFQLNSEASLGYFTSFRHSNFHENSIGEKDLFEITRPNSSPVFFVFKGMTYDERSKSAIPAIVSLRDLTDTTKAEQKLVTDVTTGRFRFDMKFDNHYKLTVEVGDKVYFSKELFFPYQADLFETFLDIPLKDIPAFNLKLHDVLEHEADTVQKKVMLDETKTPTLVLVRKIQYDDPDLVSLLKKKIPMSFRKKLMDQLQQTAFVDERPDEPLKEALSESKVMDSIYSLGNAVLKKLVSEKKEGVERLDLTTSLRNSSANDSVTLHNLSDIEKRIVSRITNHVFAKNDTSRIKVIDDLFSNDLNPKEIDRIVRFVAQQIKKAIDLNKDSAALMRFDSLVVEKRKRIDLKRPNAEAWGILYTIEASRYKFLEMERLSFEGFVTLRADSKRVPKLKLLLTDDRGMIYNQSVTNDNGEITYANLVPGKRYHVLVDDYLIALVGRSKYQMAMPAIKSNQEDYLKFYYSLSPEERRVVDRIVADSIKNDDYKRREILKWQDEADYQKLTNEERKLVEEVAVYLSATSDKNKEFFLNETTAYQYDHADEELRQKINRLISRRAKPGKLDSLFLQKLTDRQKDFISQLKKSRAAKKIVIEDVLLSRQNSDFWYVIDEISTAVLGKSKAVSISGKLVKHLKPAPDFQIALLDEFGQLIHADNTDSAGSFRMFSVITGKTYKVVITNGNNIPDILHYKLVDLKIETGDEDFYSQLNPEERRAFDRIMATMTAGQQYETDSTLFRKDQMRYNSLTAEQKEFIERLRGHLFAKGIDQDNTHLKGVDNHYYYSLLNPEERNFINRYIVQSHYNTIENSPIQLSRRDQVHYSKLTEKQRLFIESLRKRRLAKADVFAENPVLMVDRFWTVLDSVKKPNTWTDPKISLAGTLYDKITNKPVRDISVMVTDGKNELMAQVTTDSLGQFSFLDLPSEYDYKLLAENRRILFSEKFRFEVRGLHMITNQTPHVALPRVQDAIIYFDFDSSKLNKEEEKKLIAWISSLRETIGNVRIKLEGHADPAGSYSYNQKLSERRANTIREFMLRSGFAPGQLSVAGFGEMKLRYHGASSGLNRRVEALIH